MSKPHVSLIQHRRASLEGKPEARRAHASLSSEEPVARSFGSEVLVHSPDAIDMSRAADGLPLLLNHERDELPVGRIESIRIDGPKLRGDLVFSEATETAREAYALVEDGTLTDVSISYRIEQWERGESKDEVRVTRWTPLEGSLVSVPADATVGIGRQLEVPKVAEEVTTEAPTVPTEKTNILDEIKQRTSAGLDEGARRENERLDAIGKVATGMARSFPQLAAELEQLTDVARQDRSMAPDAYRSLVLDLISGHPVPLSAEAPARSDVVPFQKPGNTHRGFMQPGGDVKERAAEGMQLALLERAGADVSAEQAGNEYRGWSLLDMARDSLELHGHNTRGWSSEQIARAAINMSRAISPGTAALATSDFPAVTEAVLTKRINDAFAASPVTWNRWCSTTEVPDFKAFTVPRLSQISDLPVVLENAAYEDLTQVDAKETATLVKHGGLMSFTWEAIVNDDQRMFQRTAQSMGESAARVLDKKAYAVLTDNGLMGDGTALFAVGHGNLQATTPLDLDGIIKLRTAMARQTDDNSIELGIELRYVLVPEELRDVADNLAGSEYLPWTEASPGAQRVNTVRSTFTVVPTIRLTDVNDWYAASANGGTVEIAFLTGNRNPALMRDEGWDTDALHWKIRHPSVAYAVDWRGLQSATNV